MSLVTGTECVGIDDAGSSRFTLPRLEDFDVVIIPGAAGALR